MNTVLKQANFQIPEDLLNELRATVGKGELSRFVSEALTREFQRLRQLTAIDETFGAWKGGKHPKLAVRVGRFVGNIKKPLVENAAMHQNSLDGLVKSRERSVFRKSALIKSLCYKADFRDF